jgi:protein required for attachment to host cells
VPQGSFDGSRALNQAINSDRPGDAQESVGGGRHAIEPRTDAHRHAEAEFVRHVGDKLKHFAESGEYDELVVVAAPKALGDLRSHWDSHFRQRFVKQEIHGDWTKMGATEVAEHLRSHPRGSTPVRGA